MGSPKLFFCVILSTLNYFFIAYSILKLGFFKQMTKKIREILLPPLLAFTLINKHKLKK